MDDQSSQDEYGDGYSGAQQTQQPLMTTKQTDQAAPAPSQPVKPKPAITEHEAQALLALNNLQSAPPRKANLPINLVIAMAVLIILAIASSFLLGAFKPGSSKANGSGSIGLPNQSPTSTGRGVNRQINQDVKTCSNPVNATLVC